MDRTPRLGRGRGKRARGSRGSSRGRVNPSDTGHQSSRHPDDMNSYPSNHRHPASNHEVPRLGRGRGSMSRGGRGRGRSRRPMEPSYNSSPNMQPQQPNYEVSSEPQHYQQSARPSTPDMSAPSRVGMEGPTNLSYSSAPVTLHAGPGMRPPPIYTRAHISPRVPSPMGPPQAFVYTSSYPSMRSPPPHMIQYSSPAAMPIPPPRQHGSILDPLPPQRQIYSTEIPKSYQYGFTQTNSTHVSSPENPSSYNQTYDNHSPAQNYPPPDNPYASSPFIPDEYGGVSENYEAPASHGHTSNYNPYSDPAAKRQKVCTFFNTMGCKYGDKCRFLHVKDDSVDVDFAICWDFNTLRGCSNRSCRWEHRACSKASPHPYDDGVECKPEYGLQHELREQEKKENLSDGSDIQTDQLEKSILPAETSDGKEEVESEV